MTRLQRIVAEFGGTLYGGGARALIPGPGHGRADRSVSLAETEDGRILIHCFSPRDDWRNVRRMLMGHRLWLDETASPKRRRLSAAQPHAEEKAARAKRFWEEASPITSTIAERYLACRSITRSSWNESALRFHFRMTSLDDRLRRPALLAALHDPGSALCGIQATLLSRYGAAKAALPTPRRVIGKLIGGAVRLEPFGETLVIAEGVETALSASDQLHLPAWAALTAENLARFEPPLSLRTLVIAHDNDEAGRTASNRLVKRLDGKLNIKVAHPPPAFNDWNAFACSL